MGGDGLLGGLQCCGAAQHHALAVVTVAGDGVELAQRRLVGARHVREGLQQRQQLLGLRGGFGAAGPDGHLLVMGDDLAALTGGDAAGLVGGRVAGGEPQFLEVGVEVHQGQGDPGHVERCHLLADDGVHDRESVLGEQLLHGAVEHEQLFVLGGAQAVDQHGDVAVVAAGGAGGFLGEDAFDQQRRDALGGVHLVAGDAGLAVDAQAQGVFALRHGEQGLVSAGQGAAGEGDAH